MAKIAPVSAKYIVVASITIEGVVDKPDVIGAVFGQTEGLLGADLELRELQRSGRIGRIEVNVDTKSGKTQGQIIIPSSMDKAETAIIAASLEIIQRIGPCNAKILVEKIEDVRISKRQFVIDRAKALLQKLTDTVLPDSQELADEVAYSVRVMEISDYGSEKLPAGPNVDDSDEIIIVEGRADVVNLLKHGFKNAIAINGTSVPETIKTLTRSKTVTVFVDGDRGGDLIIKELSQVAEIDFVTKAPDGKEVEEITKKEIHKALRSRVSLEQALLDIQSRSNDSRKMGGRQQQKPQQNQRMNQPQQRTDNKPQQQKPQQNQRQQQPQNAPVKATGASDAERASFRELLDDLIGTKGAYVLDDGLNILGKVPVSELITTVKSLSDGIYAVILDEIIQKDLLEIAEKAGVKYLIGMDTKVKNSPKVTILVESSL